VRTSYRWRRGSSTALGRRLVRNVGESPYPRSPRFDVPSVDSGKGEASRPISGVGTVHNARSVYRLAVEKPPGSCLFCP